MTGTWKILNEREDEWNTENGKLKRYFACTGMETSSPKKKEACKDDKHPWGHGFRGYNWCWYCGAIRVDDEITLPTEFEKKAEEEES